jgi:hypothetical protein
MMECMYFVRMYWTVCSIKDIKLCFVLLTFLYDQVNIGEFQTDCILSFFKITNSHACNQ